MVNAKAIKTLEEIVLTSDCRANCFSRIDDSTDSCPIREPGS